MREPLVSAIMCVRNGAKYLREALDSIANQRLEDLQVIIVDDGSTDDSVQIARDHSLMPEIVSQKPLGLGAALNYGIRVARGRFLSFLDCDDVWMPGRLDSMLAVFEKDSKIDFVFGKTVNTDEHLNEISQPRSARLIGATMIKRASALRIGELRTDVSHAAILDWSGRASILGLQYHMMNEVVLLRRIHGENMGIRDRLKARADLLRVVRGHLKRKRQ
jgi:glycosyltransferase involved in cell wall biosynthesis